MAALMDTAISYSIKMPSSSASSAPLAAPSSFQEVIAERRRLASVAKAAAAAEGRGADTAAAAVPEIAVDDSEQDEDEGISDDSSIPVAMKTTVEAEPRIPAPPRNLDESDAHEEPGGEQTENEKEAEEKIDAAATTTITNTATEEPSPAAPPTTAVPSLKEVVASLESTLLTSSPAAAVTVEPHRHSAAEEDALLAKYLQRLGVPGAAEGIIMEGGAWVRRDDGVGDDRREEIESAFPAAASMAVTPVHLDGRIIDESDNHSASGAEDTAGEMFADSAALMKARQLHAAGDITSVQLAMLIQKEREFLCAGK
jgi:hypothetical protein